MPMRYGPILGRVVAVIATLLVVGGGLRLIGGILTPVLPPAFMQALDAGWQQLYSIAGPAVPSITALIIVGSLIWLFVGRR